MNRGAIWLAFCLGVRDAQQKRLLMIGTAVLLVTLVVSYGGVLRALPIAELSRAHLTRPEIVWYLILTQTAVIGIGGGFKEFEQMMRDHSIEVHLIRPVSHWPLKLAEWAGQQFWRIGVLLPLAILLGIALAGPFPWHYAYLLILPGYAALVILTLSSFLIVGSTALWIGDARPVFWVYQKLIFLLGGLLWPLGLYPKWLQLFAWKTPFPAMIAVVGNFALNPHWGAILHGMELQMLWMGAFLALCALSEAAIRRHVARHG